MELKEFWVSCLHHRLVYTLKWLVQYYLVERPVDLKGAVNPPQMLWKCPQVNNMNPNQTALLQSQGSLYEAKMKTRSQV